MSKTLDGFSLDNSYARELEGFYLPVQGHQGPAPKTLRVNGALAVELGCEPVVIAEADRAAYADVIQAATEFSRSIIVQSTTRLGEIGIENPGGYLSALVQSTVERALRDASGPSPLI